MESRSTELQSYRVQSCRGRRVVHRSTSPPVHSSSGIGLTMSTSGQFNATALSFLGRGGRLRARIAAGSIAAAALFASSAIFAQKPTTGRYLPLDQTTAPGVAAQWSTAGRRDARPGWQLIRVELPGD